MFEKKKFGVTREWTFHRTTLYHRLSSRQNSFNLAVGTSVLVHCCFVRPSRYPSPCGFRSWFTLRTFIRRQNSLRHFLTRRHLGRQNASLPRNTLPKLSLPARFQLHSEWVSSTRYAVTNRKCQKGACRSAFISSAVPRFCRSLFGLNS